MRMTMIIIFRMRIEVMGMVMTMMMIVMMVVMMVMTMMINIMMWASVLRIVANGMPHLPCTLRAVVYRHGPCLPPPASQYLCALHVSIARPCAIGPEHPAGDLALTRLRTDCSATCRSSALVCSAMTRARSPTPVPLRTSARGGGHPRGCILERGPAVVVLRPRISTCRDGVR